MKRNLDKPDYRSMNEAKLKLELAGLEQRILGITGDSLDYQHYASSWTGAGTRRRSRRSRN